MACDGLSGGTLTGSGRSAEFLEAGLDPNSRSP